MMGASWSGVDCAPRERPMPCADLKLTSPDGVLTWRGVPLEDWDVCRDQMAERAAGRHWRGPYHVAPAPGRRPEGVAVDVPGPVCWGCKRPDPTADHGRLCVPCDDAQRESDGNLYR